MKTLLLMCALSCVSLACSPGFAAGEKLNYQLYFSPEDHLADRLISLIDREEKSIEAAIYCLSHREIAKALIAAKKRGVAVEVIVDPFSLRSKVLMRKLAEGGISLSVWDPKTDKKRSLMHDKFCVFGGRSVWTGSFNFTYDATRSHKENAIVLQDEEIAKKYRSEFQVIKREGCRPYFEYLALHPSKRILSKQDHSKQDKESKS